MKNYTMTTLTISTPRLIGLQSIKKKYKTIGRVKSKLKYNNWSDKKQQWFDDIFDDLCF